jgi:hypothetical protein
MVIILEMVDHLAVGFNMKKLHILLFSILISFNSYADSPSGKGLWCKVDSDFAESFPSWDTTPRLVWFEGGRYKIPIVNGYRIEWSPPYLYIEKNTKYIKFLEPDRGTSRFVWWKDMLLNRETLILDRNENSFVSIYQCEILDSKKQIIDILNEVIEDAKKTNKI